MPYYGEKVVVDIENFKEEVLEQMDDFLDNAQKEVLKNRLDLVLSDCTDITEYDLDEDE